MSGRPSIESYARQRYRLPNEWVWFRLERVGGRDPSECFATNITGAVPGGFITRGKRKGMPNWRLPRTREVTLTVTDLEYDEHLLEWEMETGRCHRCGGKGQESVGFDRNGPIVRQCRRCAGTGTSPNSGGEAA